ncbi:PmoA family protein [Planococcus sp. APC 4015]|nr:PmoA family protein [Planococcus sp. APC 4015]
MTLSLSVGETALVVADGDVELLSYTFVPDSPQYESPKPYLHPLRTRSGRVVSLYRPHDHVWHKGIAWSLPVVGDENFWGGPTFVRDEGYVALPNDGAQRHISMLEADLDDEVAHWAHALDWITEDGRRLFAERRAFTARVVAGDVWALTVEIAMTNVSADAVPLGSPTTRGRDNAGYGGLFWRGPRSFTDGTLVTATATGPGSELRGQRHEWMGFAGRHDGDDAASLVVMVDHAANPQHPPQWFARSEEFAALNPAPFFSEELVVQPGETVRFVYGVGIADGEVTDAAAVAEAVRAVIGSTP